MKMNESINTRRIVQTLLFALLPIIDIFRTSGTGWQMMLSAQILGTVVGVIIMLHYGVRNFLKWYNLIWIVGAIIANIFLPYWFFEEAIKYHYLYEIQMFYFNLAIYGMILTHIVRRFFNKSFKFGIIVEKIRKPKLIFGIWLAYVLWATVMKDNTYRPEFDLLFFSFLYLIEFDKTEVKQLMEDMVNGVIIGFTAMQFLAFFFRPYVEYFIRYRGMYYNSNMFSLMCLVILLICLLKMTSARKQKGIMSRGYWCWGILYLSVFSLLLLSIGRISIALGIAGTIFYVVIRIWLEKNVWKKIVKSIAMFSCCIVIVFPLVYMCVSYAPRIIKKTIVFQDEYWNVGDLNDEDNYVTISEFINSSLGRFIYLYRNEDETVNTTQAVEEEDNFENLPIDPEWENKTYYLDEAEHNSSDERIAIWKTYLSEINMFGHTKDEWTLWISPHIQHVHAHNIYLMEMYVYGVIGGVLFTIWIAYYLVAGWKQIKNAKTDSILMFPLLIAILVTTYGFFELCWMSGQITWMLLLLAQKQLMIKD